MAPKRRIGVKRKSSASTTSAAKKAKAYRRIIGDGRLEKYLDTLFLPDISTIIASYEIEREAHYTWNDREHKHCVNLWPIPRCSDCKRVDQIVFGSLRISGFFGGAGVPVEDMTLRGHVFLNLHIGQLGTVMLSVQWPLNLDAIRRLTAQDVKEPPPGSRPSWFFYYTDHRGGKKLALPMQRISAWDAHRFVLIQGPYAEWKGSDAGRPCECISCITHLGKPVGMEVDTG
jgi:hypothetical protein